MFQNMQTVARETGLLALEHNAISSLAHCYERLGQRSQADELWGQSLDLSRHQSDRSTEAQRLYRLGLDSKQRGELQQAIQFFEQAIPFARNGDDKTIIGVCLADLAWTYADLGEWRHAIELFERRLVLARKDEGQLGGIDVASVEQTISDLAHSYYKQGEPRLAVELFEQALVRSRWRRQRNWQAEEEYLRRIGALYILLHEADYTTDLWQRALAAARNRGDSATAMRWEDALASLNKAISNDRKSRG
jgi:tetratricopeptide (TPR) repeat protein